MIIHISFDDYPKQTINSITEASLDEFLPHVVKLKTCQRYEYFLAPPLDKVSETVQKLEPLLKASGMSYGMHTDQQALGIHLFRVVSGLASNVLGETEIQGQIKAAYIQAIENGTVNSTLHGLFQKALFVGKKIRTETSLSDGGLSYAGAGFRAIKDFAYSFNDFPTIGLVGSGSIAQDLHQLLKKNQFKVSKVYTKNIQRGARLFEDSDIYSYDAIHEHLVDLDILVCATNLETPLLTYDSLATISGRYKNPQLCLDFGSPSNIEDSVAQLPMIALISLQELRQSINSVSDARKQAVQKAEHIVTEQITEYLNPEPVPSAKQKP